MTAILHLNLGRLAAGVVNGVPEGIALAVLAWLCLQMFVRHSSSKRFAIWFSALVATLALPLARIWGAPVTGNRAASSLISVPEFWTRGIAQVWIALSGLALIRVTLGISNLHKLRGDARLIDPAALDPALPPMMKVLGNGRKVQLAISSRVSVPAVIGFFKPIILLPAWALQDLSPEQLNSVLIHELAHVRRWDDWTNLAQKLARALLFFHPAIWWIDHQLSLEREMACDELVLASTGNPRAYADCLVTLAEKNLLRRTLGMAQALLGRVGQTSRRVTQILDPNHSPVSRRWKPAFALMAIVSASGTLWLMRAPDLVAFRVDEPSPTVVNISARSAPVGFDEAGKGAAVVTPQMTLAKFKQRNNPAGSVNAIAKERAVRTVSAPLPWKATTQQQPVLEPRVLQANNPISSAQAPSEMVYIVTEMESFSASPPARWTLCLWRITVVKSLGSDSQDLVNRHPQVALPPNQT